MFSQPQLKLQSIPKPLSRTPLTNHGPKHGDATELGWLQPGDPRSDLILSLLSEQGTALRLLLHGLPPPQSPSAPSCAATAWSTPPAPALVASISPHSRVRCRDYDTPTYVVHGTEDEIVPFGMAERFVALLREMRLRCGFLAVQGARHIYDLHLAPGTVEWEESIGPGYEFLFETVGRSF